MLKRSRFIPLYLLAASVLLQVAHAATPVADSDLDKRIDRLLRLTPLIDGHNDLPWALREGYGAGALDVNLNLSTAALKAPLNAELPPLHTDIPRLRAGHVGAQFWSVWIPVDVKGPEAIQTTIEQIDLVKSLAARYPASFELALSSADIRRIHKAGRIASLIGIEGGHQINESLPGLRQMYALGARYMTLTHTTNTRWADSATDNPQHHGLTPFGKAVVHEMNRLGMLVDISHVSEETMLSVLDATRSPVIFSHSSARAITEHPRNVSDAVLRRVRQNGGVVMVNFYTGYVSNARNRWVADRAAEQTRYSAPPYAGLYIGQPERAKAAMQAWDEAHPKPRVSVTDIADHIEHIRDIAGIDHVGLGSDFDGVEDLPEPITGVDGFTVLLRELLRRGWSDADIRALAGENLLRVLAANEAVAVTLKSELPSTATIAALDAPAATH
jgi:membrane dipeptidase